MYSSRLTPQKSATVEACFIASVIPCTLVLEIAAALANTSPTLPISAIDRPKA